MIDLFSITATICCWPPKVEFLCQVEHTTRAELLMYNGLAAKSKNVKLKP